MSTTIDTGVNKREISDSNTGLVAKRLDFSEIPIIDLSPMLTQDAEAREALAKQIYSACTEVGFFYVTGHGISPAIVEEMELASAGFFNQKLVKKMQTVAIYRYTVKKIMNTARGISKKHSMLQCM